VNYNLFSTVHMQWTIGLGGGEEEEWRKEWAYMVGDISGVVGKTNEWLVVAMVEQVVKVVVKKEEKEKPR